jgi:hypothetical protein
MKAAGKTRVGGIVGNLFSTGGKLAGASTAAMAGARLVPFAGAVVTAASAVVDLTKASIRLAYEQERHAKELAQYSPQIAASFGALEANRAFRKVDTGFATAGTTDELTQSIDRFEKAVQPIDQLGRNLGNLAGSAIMQTLATIAEGLQPLAEAVEDVLEVVTLGGYQRGGGGDQGQLFGDWLASVDKQAEARQRAADVAIRGARVANDRR